MSIIFSGITISDFKYDCLFNWPTDLMILTHYLYSVKMWVNIFQNI